MPKAWKWKLALVLASFILGLYLIVPTALHFNQKWIDSETTGTPVPWYLHVFPKKVINLGLDLRGGIYIEMQVDLAGAMKRHADFLSGELERSLKDKDIAPVAITQAEDGSELHVRLKSEADIDQLDKILNKLFRSALIKKTVTTEEGSPTAIIKVQDEYLTGLKTNIVERSVETIRNRIDRYGVAEPSITLAGGDRIAVELPGIQDPDRAISIIKMTGQLEFKMVDATVAPEDVAKMVADVRAEKKFASDDFSITTVAAINEALKDKIPATDEIAFEIKRDPVTKKILGGAPYLLIKKVELTGDMLSDARMDVDQNKQEPFVSLTFNAKGAEIFGDLTTANVDKQLAIVLDGGVNSAPVIQEPIRGGSARITLGRGDFNTMQKDAGDLALILQEGSLPAQLTEATKNVIGPSLGQETIQTSLKAAMWAAILVVIFMMFYYKMSGVYANIALMLNVILILGALSLFGATLTLPGIAGIVLTMGMAVDANVLICERIREELGHGKTVKAAVDSGYSNALRAVVDSNITTLIAGIVLYQFGTGPIKGFAITLSIGILTTLFTAIVVTRLIYDYRIIKGKITKLSI